MSAPIKNLGQVKMHANGATDVGLSILSITATMSVWSAISPSWFTYRSFASKTPEERASARTTMFLAAGASMLSNAGMYLVFRRTVPTIAGVVSTLGLLALSWFAVHSGDDSSASTMAEKRNDQLAARNRAKEREEEFERRRERGDLTEDELLEEDRRMPVVLSGAMVVNRNYGR